MHLSAQLFSGRRLTSWLSASDGFPYGTSTLLIILSLSLLPERKWPRFASCNFIYLFVSDVNAATASPNASRLLRKDPTGQVAAWKVREDLRKRLVKHLAKSSTDKQGMLRLVVAYSTKFTESLRYLLCQVAWRKGRCMPKVRPWWLLRLANIVSASRGSRRALNRDAPSPYWKDASPAFEISPAAQLTTIAVNNEISHLLFLTRRQTIGTAHPTAKVFHPFFDGILDI